MSWLLACRCFCAAASIAFAITGLQQSPNALSIACSMLMLLVVAVVVGSVACCVDVVACDSAVAAVDAPRPGGDSSLQAAA